VREGQQGPFQFAKVNRVGFVLHCSKAVVRRRLASAACTSSRGREASLLSSGPGEVDVCLQGGPPRPRIICSAGAYVRAQRCEETRDR
jgi:hypothetical protein